MKGGSVGGVDLVLVLVVGEGWLADGWGAVRGCRCRVLVLVLVLIFGEGWRLLEQDEGGWTTGRRVLVRIGEGLATGLFLLRGQGEAPVGVLRHGGGFSSVRLGVLLGCCRRRRLRLPLGRRRASSRAGAGTRGGCRPGRDGRGLASPNCFPLALGLCCRVHFV